MPVTIIGPGGSSLAFGKALVDSGADDTIFPLDVANQLGIVLKSATGHAMQWRGQRFLLRYGEVELEFVDDKGSSLRWTAVVAFTTAAMRYPLLGVSGCLSLFDVKFLGAGHVIELEPNGSFSTTGGVQP